MSSSQQFKLLTCLCLLLVVVVVVQCQHQTNNNITEKQEMFRFSVELSPTNAPTIFAFYNTDMTKSPREAAISFLQQYKPDYTLSELDLLLKTINSHLAGFSSTTISATEILPNGGVETTTSSPSPPKSDVTYDLCTHKYRFNASLDMSGLISRIAYFVICLHNICTACSAETPSLAQ